ncbi:MAG TPA: thiamine phosphate synthase [Polyangiaceae bacterium]
MAGTAVRPRLIAITDRTRASAAQTLGRFARLARAAQPGSVVFQLRDRELAAAERLSFGRELVRLAHAEGQLVQVNDRLDLALLLGADGAHLGEASVALPDARRLLGHSAFLTRASHEPARAGACAADGVLLSPILAERKGREALGLRGIESARASLDASENPALLFALGGIDAGGARRCREAGADGVAVIGAVLDAAADLDALVRALSCER